MARTDDNSKLTPEEEAGLKELYEQSKAEHGDRYLTLTKDDATAKYILKQWMKERGETAVQWSEVEARLAREDKYGRADWERFPELDGINLTKPLRLLKRPSAALWEALERFVQLSDSSLGDFKTRYPAFMPAWFYSVPSGNDAEPNDQTGLLGRQSWRRLLRAAWHSGFHPEYVAQLVNSIRTVPPGNTQFEIAPVCDAQRAVLAMMLESWRARFCPKCGTPFVARKAADKYWPKECFTEQRREKQLASKRKRARKRAKSLRRKKR